MVEFDEKSIGRIGRASLNIIGFRNQAPGYDVRSGEGARRFGGRFNPPRSFPVLYLCTTKACVLAELMRQSRRQGLPIEDLLPRELWKIEAELDSILDLRAPTTLEALAIEATDLVQDDLRLTRQIGETAYEQGFQGLMTKSATGVDDVVVVFPENLRGALLHCSMSETWSTSGDIGE